MNSPILDRGFNVAVLHMASRLFPTGYDISPNAPETFEALQQQVRRTGRMVVFSGGSDRTIFSDPEVNYAFRAWHDWCHLKGNHDFSPAGEAGACAMQQAQLRAVYGDTAQTRKWCAILDAEINGQGAHYYATGTFVEDQMAFVRQYLASHISA